jgi:peptide/nickel transport system substrate-binding protein
MKKRKRIVKVLMVALMVGALFLLVNAGEKPEKGKVVPRNRTMISVGGGGEALLEFSSYESWNPYFIGHIAASGAQLFLEPLYFYSWMADEEIPWLAESYRYNSDFTELTIKIRRGVEWSDGEEFTARDVAYTLNMLRDNAPDMRYSTDIKKWVKSAEAVDDLTVKVSLKNANPRFMFNYLMNHADIGIWIVPEHIWKDQDPTLFTNYDPAKGWPVVTGAYSLAYVGADKIMWDLREDWWAAKTGFQDLPKVERVIFLPAFDETKHSEMMIANEVDVSLCLAPGNIKKVFNANPKVSSFSGHEPPYGYKDWWPTALGFNNSKPPFDDPEIRRAISYAINRDDVVTYGLEGVGTATKVTFPEFPALMPYIDSIQDLFEKYESGEFDLKKSAEIMERKGYTKDSDGFWVGPDGKRFEIVITSFPVLEGICPPVVENLRRAGFDASFDLPPDFFSRMSLGIADAFIFGHAASVRDPYMCLDLYHSRFVAPIGESTFPFYRWDNPEFSDIVDEMATIAYDDPRMFSLFHQAMDIWLREVPDIPLCSFYHRNPINYTYWTGWPTEDNPYINDANWHKTVLLMLVRLQPTQ